MIHPQAIVDPSADIASDVEVGPWTWIGPDVSIDSGSVIGPNVVIKGPTTIGKNNRIFQFASVGEDTQSKKYQGEATELRIGDDNVIRECCTINRGTVQDASVTTIGHRNLFMAYVHIAHDSIVGDDNVFANNASIGGHVKVGNSVILGGFTGVHQYCQVGSFAMTGMGSMVVKDVPAYVMISGDSAKACGMNVEGMRRRDYPKETIQLLRRAYKIVYRQGLTLVKAIAELEAVTPSSPELDIFIESLRTSSRGITR